VRSREQCVVCFEADQTGTKEFGCGVQEKQSYECRKYARMGEHLFDSLASLSECAGVMQKAALVLKANSN